MKTLKTTDNGGFPFELDDLRYLSGGINEMSAAAFRGLSGTDIVNAPIINISVTVGVAGTTFGWSDGWVLIDNEFYRSTGGYGTINPGQYLKFDIQEVADPSGAEEFENGVTHDTYVDRIVNVVAVDTNPGYDARTVPEISTIMSQQYVKSNSWTTIAVADAHYVAVKPIQYRKTKDNCVQIRGSFKQTILVVGSIPPILTLPSDCVPLTNQNSIAIRTTAVNDGNTTTHPVEFIKMKINTSGELKFAWVNSNDQTNIEVNDEYDLQMITFPLD